MSDRPRNKASTAKARDGSWRHVANMALIACFVCTVYVGSLSSPFLFDDEPAIIGNPTIQRPGSWSVFLPPDNGSAVTGRPLVNLSLAIDHALGGDRPGIYHATNLLIHVLAAITLYCLVRRVLGLPSLRARFEDSASAIALSTTLFWALHPLLTESVVCIAQRTETLCGFILLVTLYAFARGAAADGSGAPPRSQAWLAVSVACCLLGMAAKEVMVVAPIIVLLFDRAFVAGSFVEAWNRRRRYYLGLAGTWGFLALLVLRSGGSRGVAAGFGLGVSPWQYLVTQGDAIVTYLKLALWPHPLVLDYGRTIAPSFAAVWWQCLLVAALIGATLWALRRRPVSGFLGAFFFIVLAPSSSVVPLVTQTIAEHRMYLPLIPIAAVAAVSIHRFISRKWSLPAFAIVVVCLAATTLARTRDYRDAVTIWTDTVENRPDNSRAHNNLALALHQTGDDAGADLHFAEAIRLQPDYASAHYNWGVALLDRNLFEQAVAQLQRAADLVPSHADAYVNLGNALARSGRAEAALAQFDKALAIAPAADVHYNMGVVLMDLGRTTDAVKHLEASFAADPTEPRALIELGRIAERAGRTDEAMHRYADALHIAPDEITAHRRLALLQARLGQFAEAEKHFRAIVRLQPKDVDARANLANTCLAQGRLREAVALYEEVLRLRPGDAQTIENLRIAREALAGR